MSKWATREGGKGVGLYKASSNMHLKSKTTTGEIAKNVKKQAPNLCMLRRRSLKRHPAYVSATSPHAPCHRILFPPRTIASRHPLRLSPQGAQVNTPLQIPYTSRKTRQQASPASQMANLPPFFFMLLILVPSRLIPTVGLTLDPVQLDRLSTDPADVETASLDFGGFTRAEPLAVLHPSSVEDIVGLVRSAYESASGVMISARGHGHSINGQAQADKGVVIEMSRMSQQLRIGSLEPGMFYADVWGGELWIEVLRSALEYGLAPRSWTDYLYLSVGGTLSNGGISGQAFNHGPQIANVHELDVVTGMDMIMQSGGVGFIMAHVWLLSPIFFKPST